MPPDFHEIRNTIIEFQFLEKGWNSYDSEQLDYTTINDAVEVVLYIEDYVNVLPIVFEYSVFAAPCPDGGIQIDITSTNGKSLELVVCVDEDSYMEYFLDDNGIEEQDSIMDITELDDLLERVLL